MWGHSCLPLVMEIVDWPLVLSGSDSESVLLDEEHGLCSELCVELLVVGEEGSVGVGL